MEAVQQCVLTILENESIIQDTRDLGLPGNQVSAKSQEGQLVIQGALNSLLSKEVRILTTIPYESLHLLF